MRPATSHLDGWHASLITFLAFAAIAAGAADYYVAPAGNDGAAGTLAQPWATFARAASMAQAGDTVFFRGGTYLATQTDLTRSGTITAPITFIAFPGERPILDGQGTAGGMVILKPGTSHLRLSGLGVRNFRIWGISLEGENRFVMLDHLDVGGGEAAVHFTDGVSAQPPTFGPVEDVALEDSVLHDSAFTVVDCTPGPCNRMMFRRLEVFGGGLGSGPSFGADGIGFENGYPVTVEDCYIHDNGGDGIDLNSRNFEGNVQGVLVRRNRVARNHLQGIKLWSGGRMENNAVWGQGITPVFLGRYQGHFEVVNNTIAFNMWDPSFAERDYALVAAYPLDGPSANITLTLINNIFAFNASPLTPDGGATGIYLGSGVKLTEHNNLYFSRDDAEIQAEFVTGRETTFSRAEIASGVWTSATGQGQGDAVTDPHFTVGWPALDLRLAAGSPAINAGTPGGAPVDDLEGRQRDAVPDLGAYEYAPPPLPRVRRRLGHA